jgi:transglutaminase-like putative cysteine protease
VKAPRGRLVVLIAAMVMSTALLRADESAIYRASGPDSRLFDQYDNDGYSLIVAPRSDGSLELLVRVSDGPLESRAPYPAAGARDGTLPVSPERDAFARTLAGDAATQAEAVERILWGVASALRYDPDRSRRQDPASVFASRRAHCVGYSELSVDLLRRVGIPARTVQGLLRTKPGTEGYDSRIGGVYHRWIEVYYPDRGFVFSDPSASINAVDARYVPFGRRALERPKDLTVLAVETSGRLDFPVLRLPEATLRVRSRTLSGPLRGPTKMGGDVSSAPSP